MPRFLVEAYLTDTPGAVDDARRQARRTAELELDVRYLRTTFLPRDEMALHVFEAPSASVLDAAVRRTTLRFERIVEAVE